jgi:hypothetical protein
MTMLASGTFAVKLDPQPLYDSAADATLGRLSIEKQFHGHLEATSKGEMLSAGTAVKGSAVYVAIERVTGTLHGLAGSFVLHHTGIMDRGTPQLTVAVVPDSGTGQLIGLSGEMTINISDGKHFYEFEYLLAQAPL